MFQVEWEKEGSALRLRKQRRKMADAISREISDKAVSYTRRASEKPSARHRLPPCPLLFSIIPRISKTCEQSGDGRCCLYSRKGGGKKTKKKNSTILPPRNCRLNHEKDRETMTFDCFQDGEKKYIININGEFILSKY